MRELFLVDPGPRPPFAELAGALWGDADFDSDGDSSRSGATTWTELTLTRRTERSERIDIDPVGGEGRLILRITSDSETLVQKAADFLSQRCGGVVRANLW
jgi:hypothetical protein